MKAFTIYSIVAARMIIILVAFLFAAPFFFFTILGTIGDIYITGLFKFCASTKNQITLFDKQL